MSTVVLQSAVTSAPTTGTGFNIGGRPFSVQAAEAGTGTVTATVLVDVSDDNSNWTLAIITIILNGASPQSDSFPCAAAYEWVRTRVTAITGTSAAVTTTLAA